MAIPITEAALTALAESILRHGCSGRVDWQLRMFKAHFGVSPFIATCLWNRMVAEKTLPVMEARPTHLLWALMFLKLYSSEATMSTICSTTAKTFRQRVWSILWSIAALDVIVWDNRFLGNNGSICLVTVDGTDFPMNEPMPFSPQWYSHKFKGAGLRYEIAICIQTGDIVWCNGPFPCGSYSDRLIARDEGLEYSMEPGEMYVADGGYRDGFTRAETPNGLNDADQWMKALARARQETVNARFKEFGVCRQRYRHAVAKHGIVFGAVVNISQVIIEEESPLFQIQYYDR